MLRIIKVIADRAVRMPRTIKVTFHRAVRVLPLSFEIVGACTDGYALKLGYMMPNLRR